MANWSGVATGQAPKPSPTPATQYNPWRDSSEAQSWKNLFAKKEPYQPTQADMERVMGEAAQKVAHPVPMIGDAAETWSPEQEAAAQRQRQLDTGTAPTQTLDDLGLRHYDDYEVKPLSEEEWAALTSSQQRAVLANQLMFEASQSGDPAEQKAIYDYLGLSEEQRANPPETFATMEDIARLAKVDDRPLPDNTTERTAVNDRNAAVLDALRAVSSRIKPTDSTQSAPSALNLDKDIPKSFQELLGRGLSTTDKTNLESNFFDAMVYTPKDTWINTPGMLESFSKDFGAAIKDLPVEDVAALFKLAAENAKKTDAPDIDVNALLEFYGLGG